MSVWRLNAASCAVVLASGRAAHYEPLLSIAADRGLDVLVVPQVAERFELRHPTRPRPTVLVLGDDTDAALGPGAFHASSLRRALRLAAGVVVVSCEPLAVFYVAAAAAAAASGRDAILVETRIERELEWLGLLQRQAPRLPLLAGTVEGGTA